MIILANTMIGLASILNSLIFIAQILVIARVIVSWVSADPRNKLVEIIIGTTEPMLYPLRKRLPVLGGLDLSPLIFLFGLILFQYAIVQSMHDYAIYMKAQAITTIPTNRI